MNQHLLWDEPAAFAELDPPRTARVLLHAGHLLLLSVATDDELVEFGASQDEVFAAIELAGFLEPREADLYRLIWHSGRESGLGWLEHLGQLLELQPDEVDDEWPAILAALWCLRHPVLPEELLLQGPLNTRANTLLELLGSDFCVTDAQAAQAALASEIAAGKTSTFEDWALIAGSALGGGLVGWFTAGSGNALYQKGLGWLTDRVAQADDWTTELALRFELATILQQHNSARAALVVDRLRADIQQLSSNPGEARRVRMLRNAHAALTASGSYEPPLIEAPDLTDMRLADAKALVTALGVEPTLIDATGAQRSPWDLSRWVVRAQWPAPGASLAEGCRLAFSRPQERVRGLQVQQLLREDQ